MVRRYLFISAALACFGSGCVDDGTSLQIECPAIPNEDCIFNANDEDCLLSGTLNYGLFPNDDSGQSYRLALRVTNGLFTRESDIPLRPEPNNMDVTSAEVAMLSTAGGLLDFGDLPNPFSVTTSGRVPVGGSGIALVQAIPPDYVTAMKDSGFHEVEGTIVLRVRLNARTDGDVPVTSREWRWPVNLISVQGGMQNCIPADEPRAQCFAGQDGESLPYCSNL